MQVFLKIGGVAQQHHHHLAAGEKAHAAQILGGQRVHRVGKAGGGAGVALTVLQGQHHHHIVGTVVGVPQQAPLHRVGVDLGSGSANSSSTIGIRKAGPLVLPDRFLLLRRLAEQGKTIINLLVDAAQLGGNAVDGQRFEHIADDVVLDGLLGVLKVVVPAQERDVHGGAHFAHLTGKFDAGDEGHPDVGQQQIRLQLFHKLQRVQTVAGAAHQGKPQLLPGHHGAQGIPQHVLVIGHHNGINGLGSHTEATPLAKPVARPAAKLLFFDSRAGHVEQSDSTNVILF